MCPAQNASPDAPADLIGRTLGDRYRIESPLGQGGMASVYLASDTRLGCPCVLKIPHPELLAEPQFAERFAREIRSLTRLRHAHVVAIHDAGQDQGLPFAVVDYLAGGDLHQRLRAEGGRMQARAVAGWLGTVARTLDAIHEKQYLHRDIKPANLLFDEHGDVFVSDFGIATAMRSNEAEAGAEVDTTLTVAHSFVGSAAYSPPEAIERRLSPAYDQYSLAVVVYEALSGSLPFKKSGAQTQLLAKLTLDPTPLDEQVSGLPEGLSAVVMRALARDPAQRFPSCASFATAFEACLAPRVPAWRRFAVAGAGALGAVAVAAALWTLRPRREEAVVGVPPPAAGPARIHATLGTTPDEFRYAMELCSQALGSACDRSWYDSEIPREVELEPYELDPHEVTRAEFSRFVADTGYVTTAERRGFSYVAGLQRDGASWRAPLGPEASSDAQPEHPAVHLSFEDAERYCAHAGGRLPTNAEWEYAARGGERRVFPWGNEWDPARAHWIESEAQGPRPVGAFPSGATPEGLLDLAGNVWEWTSTERAEGRVAKGGSWLASNPAHLRAAAEMVEEPGESASDLGVRCARNP